MGVTVDIKGQRFGRWTVIERGGRNGRKVTWTCRCDCGTEKQVIGNNLRRGATTSCGCVAADVSSEKKVIDLTGRRFGRLTVVERQPVALRGHMHWQCKCDCGNEKVIDGQQLRDGRTTSCGCLKVELIGARWNSSEFREKMAEALSNHHGYNSFMRQIEMEEAGSRKS